MTTERQTSVPMLATIALTGLVMAMLVVWQATGVPIVTLLLVPWLIVIAALILPVGLGGHDTAPAPAGVPVRRRILATGMASVAVAAALISATDLTGSGTAVTGMANETAGKTTTLDPSASTESLCAVDTLTHSGQFR